MCLSVITGFQFVCFFIYPLLCDKYIRDISFRSLALTSDDNRLEQDLRSPYICSKSIEYAYGNRRYRSPNI